MKGLKMINKVVIGMLIFLLVLTGALCAYSYKLSREVSFLTEQLLSFQEKEEARIGVLSSEWATFRGETLASIETLDDELRSVASRLSESVVDVSEIYQKVNQAVVKISNGQGTIGTGFVLDSEGHILTPQHVVQGQPQIDVILSDGTVSAVTIVGTCEYSDIAVLKAKEVLDVEALTLVDSATVRAGEPVAVIGNPL